ncbi:MAG TPA: methionine--tRNA ligase [Polyangiaceae bacterium]|nr:methionine--tRNA ligase [Polyangiaceae bacterium]
MTRKILVTSALPYANGHIHIGHLVEYLMTDIWVRFQRMRGQRAVYVCADDTHGTAIMIRARQEGRSEEALIADMQSAHRRDFEGFQIQFDNYGSTNSPDNRELCEIFWAALRKQGLILERDVTQLYDPIASAYLADRFVKGKCPKCGSPDQYGDSCEKCGAAYSATDLVDPYSTLSGAKPVLRTALHYFVEIEQLHGFLEEWTQRGEHLQPEIANYLKGHFLAEPLRDWDVSRPGPYFGFELPDAPGNYWYVWFDAPIGYLASTAEWCRAQGERFDDWWRSDDVEIHHFIGKDITYFHTLFWPAMLKVAGYSLPTRVHVHGFLTVNGEKMSKSKGTFVMASTYLRHLDPAYLRYFYASKLTPKVDDIDLNLEEFATKVNADLVGKVVNLASRTARFVDRLSERYPEDEGLFDAGAKLGEDIAAAYDACDFARAMRLIMSLADRANEYIDRKEPWKLKKEPALAETMRDVCTVALNLYRQLAIYLSPVLPKLAQQSAELLHDDLSSWQASSAPIVGTPVGKFQHLLARVDMQAVTKMVEETLSAEPAPAAPAAPEPGVIDTDEPLRAEPLAAECSIDDFAKVDLRVARIVAAVEVPEANKLLQLTLSLGGDERRTVFAGIKAAYRPESLVGRLVVVVANLAPRRMKFGTSEGMVIAAGPGKQEVFLLAPDAGAKPGQRVH